MENPFSRIQYTDQITGPAAVDRKTGILYINQNIWHDLSAATQRFVLNHEAGHLEANTSDEFLADSIAFDKYIKQSDSLKDAVKGMSDGLSFTKQEHYDRFDALLIKALEHDAASGNELAQDFLDELEESDNSQIDSHSSLNAFFGGKKKRLARREKRLEKKEKRVEKRLEKTHRKQGNAPADQQPSGSNNSGGDTSGSDNSGGDTSGGDNSGSDSSAPIVRRVSRGSLSSTPTRASSNGGELSGQMGQQVNQNRSPDFDSNEDLPDNPDSDSGDDDTDTFLGIHNKYERAAIRDNKYEMKMAKADNKLLATKTKGDTAQVRAKTGNTAGGRIASIFGSIGGLVSQYLSKGKTASFEGENSNFVTDSDLPIAILVDLKGALIHVNPSLFNKYDAATKKYLIYKKMARIAEEYPESHTEEDVILVKYANRFDDDEKGLKKLIKEARDGNNIAQHIVKDLNSYEGDTKTPYDAYMSYFLGFGKNKEKNDAAKAAAAGQSPEQKAAKEAKNKARLEMVQGLIKSSDTSKEDTIKTITDEKKAKETQSKTQKGALVVIVVIVVVLIGIVVYKKMQ
jgi:hypothetical protein